MLELENYIDKNMDDFVEDWKMMVNSNQKQFKDIKLVTAKYF